MKSTNPVRLGLLLVLLIGAGLLFFTTAPIAFADDLVIDLDQDPPVSITAGEEFSFALAVFESDGTSDAVVLEYFIPDGVQIVDVVSSSGDPLDCMAGTPGDPLNPLSCRLGEMDDGQEPVLITISVATDPSLQPGIYIDTDAQVCLESDDAAGKPGSTCQSDAFPSDNELHFFTLVETEADLWISKLGDPQPVEAGTQTTYDLQFGNRGPSVARYAIISDTLPPQMEIVRADVVDGDPDFDSATCFYRSEDPSLDDPMICELGDILPGQEGRVVVVVQVRPDALVGPAPNTASISSDTTDPFDGPPPDAGDNESTFNTTIVDRVNVEVQKSSSPLNPIAGSTFLWTYEITNHGPSDATNVQFSDTLPSGVTSSGDTVYFHYVDDEAHGFCTLTASEPDAITCRPAGSPFTNPPYVLPAGETVEFSILVRIDPRMPPGRYTNTGAVSVGNASFSITSFVDDVEVQSIADLRIIKFVEPHTPALAGEQFTYTMIIDNLGPSSAYNVLVTDTLVTSGLVRANGCSLSVRSDGGSITTFDCNFALSKGVFDLSTMGATHLNPRSPSDMGRMIITINATAEEGLDLSNSSTVTSDSFDPDPSNNIAIVSHSIESVADLSVTKRAAGEAQVVGQPGQVFDIGSPGAFPAAPNYATSDTEVAAGRRIRYSLDIVNSGPSRADGVILVDRLPAKVTLIPGTLTTSKGECLTGTPGDASDPLTCGLGSLSSGEQVTISFDVLVASSLSDGHVLENDVYVTSETYDNNAANDYDNAQTIVKTWADMAITKLSVGENVTGYDSGLRRFIFEDLPGRVTAGRELRYEITVQNNGASDAQNVQILDLLPGQTDTGLDHDPVTFLRSDGALCRPADELQEIGVFGPGIGQGKFGQVLWCDLGTVPAGARHTFDIYVSVDSAVPEATTLTNGVFVWWGAASPPAQPGSFLGFPFPQIPPELPTTDDPFLDNNFGDTETEVAAVADVWIKKVDEPAEPRLDRANEPDLAIAGNEHRYLLRFGNDGPSVAKEIAIQDFLDFQQFAILGESFLRCEAFDVDDFVACSEANGVVTVDLLLKQNEQIIPGDLNPGDEFAFWLIAEVNAGYVLDADDFIVTNDSRITTTSTDFHTANNVDAHGTEIVGEADLSIEKQSEYVRLPITDPASAEGIITYTLTVRNDGPSDAAEVFVVDWLPSEGVFLDPALVSVTVSTGAIVEISEDGRITLIVGNDLNSEGVNEPGRLNVGSTETVTITVLVRNDVQVPTATNRARIEARRNDTLWPVAPNLLPGIGGGPRTGTTDPEPSNNEDANTVSLQGIADLRIGKFGKPDGDVRAGQSLTYTIVVDNLGPGHAHAVVVKDLIQSSGSFDLISVASDRPAKCSPESGSFSEQLQLTCELSDTLEVLTADTSGRWLLTVVVRADEAQSINNLARVTSEDQDPNLEDNEAFVQHQITDVADLEIVKSAAGQIVALGGAISLEADQVTVGQSMTYTLVVTNSGPSTAENVSVKDRVPSSLELTGVAASQGSCAVGTPEEESSVVTCNLDNLAPGTSATVLIFVDVPPSTSVGTVFINSAFAFSDIFDPHNGDNVSTNMTTVNAWPLYRVLLPVIYSVPMRALPGGTDLVVREIQAASNGITVTIENRGSAPVVDEFWVDAYINPTTVPTGTKQVWNDLGGQGLVWGIPDGALPLEPGATLTLSVGDDYYWPILSYAAWPLLAGSPVYAQVDSFGANPAVGAVLEGHEQFNGFYNNISGPISVEASDGPLPDQGSENQTYSGLPLR